MLFVALATLKKLHFSNALTNEMGFDILSQSEVTGTECERDIVRTSEVVFFLEHMSLKELAACRTHNEPCTLRALHRW